MSFWVWIWIIAGIGAYAESLRKKLKALEERHDPGEKDLAPWVDLLAFEWLLLEYRQRLREKGLSSKEVATIKADRQAIADAFHRRDALRKSPVSQRPISNGPIVLQDLYREAVAREHALDELEREERYVEGGRAHA